MGSGYDLSVSTLSPDGRVFQVEYAQKAVDNAGTVLGVVCNDGILLAVQKFPSSPIIVPGSNRQIFPVAKHAMVAICGRVPDGNSLVVRAQNEAASYERVWGEPIPGKLLAERLALFVHAYTLAWSERPYGCSLLIAVRNKTSNLELWALDCAGSVYRYQGIALGKGRVLAKTEIEKLDRSVMTCEAALTPVAKVLHKVHEDSRERPMEIEMGWLCTSSNDAFPTILDRDIVDRCSEEALRLLQAEDEDADEVMAD